MRRNLRRGCLRQPHRQRPANLANIRAAVRAAVKDAGYLHIPEGRRDHTTASIKTDGDIHGTRRSPGEFNECKGCCYRYGAGRHHGGAMC